jgi:hypothetical protein
LQCLERRHQTGIKKKADENKVGLVMHASESFGEVAASRARYGVSDVERMAKLDSLGSNMVLIHMGWASPKEIVLSSKWTGDIRRNSPRLIFEEAKKLIAKEPVRWARVFMLLPRRRVRDERIRDRRSVHQVYYCSEFVRKAA